MVSPLESNIQMDLITTKFFTIHSQRLQGRIIRAFENLYPPENMKDQTVNVNAMIGASSVVVEMIQLFKCMSLSIVHRVTQLPCYNTITATTES